MCEQGRLLRASFPLRGVRDLGSKWRGRPIAMRIVSPFPLFVPLPSEGCGCSIACMQALVGYRRRSKVSDTGRSTQSALAPAGCLLDEVSDTGGPRPLVSDTACASTEPVSGSELHPKRPL